MGENPEENENSSDENPEEDDDSGEEDSEASEDEINEVEEEKLGRTCNWPRNPASWLTQLLANVERNLAKHYLLLEVWRTERLNTMKRNILNNITSVY